MNEIEAQALREVEAVARDIEERLVTDLDLDPDELDRLRARLSHAIVGLDRARYGSGINT